MHRRRGKEQLWSIPLFWVLLAAADLLSTADAVVEVLSLQDCECQKNCLPFSDYSSHLYSQHANFVLAISWNSFFFDWVLNKKKDSVCFWSCSCVVGTQSHSGCLLFLLWLFLIVDCDFSPDCNCWSWLSAVDCRRTVVGTEETGRTGGIPARTINDHNGSGLGAKFCKICYQTRVQ